MAKGRTSVRMQAQIRRMAEQEYSIRSIAQALKISRKTVRKYLETTPEEPSEPTGWVQAVLGRRPRSTFVMAYRSRIR